MDRHKSSNIDDFLANFVVVQRQVWYKAIRRKASKIIKYTHLSTHGARVPGNIGWLMGKMEE